ncbi:uncharacterized protein BDZ99DRAFT_286391 [Mytilinidion resinicola]|uniref:IPT/TIG domain-containing protein n=1 Tax=Mytilinidion resinicola TaxID=574789 RepID=A0A6A6YPD3_9PEZI|nr:uncharacterized protein BDZ99DRAFT_286391 [Mytilinidion resinicola]KAF2810640.1 hypothetical protein BDZ99DRAFT_286391 [Mytilinidion resinicola]
MSPDARHVTVPMRIACYCRHHGEKLGFQVIFTIKTSQGQLIAQAITQPIIITDDHKTATAPGALPPTVHYGDPSFGPGDPYDNERTMMRPEYPRPYHSATDLAAMAQQFSPYSPQQGMGKVSGYQSHAMHSRNASRQASPSAQTGPNKKRKPSASAHHKIPSGLSMTRLDEMASRPMPGAPLSAGFNGLPTPLSLNTPPFMQSPEAPMIPSSMSVQNMNTAARSNPMGASIPAPLNFEPHNPHMNFDPSIPDPGAYFSTPNSAYASRSGSPTERTIANTQTGYDRGMPQVMTPMPTLHQFHPSQERPFQTFPNALSSPTNTTAQQVPPAINKIIPERGSINGGYEVTLLGSSFHRGMEAMFGDQLATTTTYWGNSTLVCLVPRGTQVGDVIVSLVSRAPDGTPQRLPQSCGRFTYVDDELARLTELTMQVLAQQSNGTGSEKEIMRSILAAAQNQSSQGGYSSNVYQSGRQHRQAAPTDKAATEESFLEILNVLDMHDGIYLPQYNLQLENGSTMLSLAAGLGFTRLVAGLLARGADPDIRDKGGYTSLMVASMRGHTQIIRRLILRGADPTVRSLRGYVAEDLTPSAEVSDMLRRTPYHSRTRSAGALSMRSRASSVASTRSLWEGPSQASASTYSSVVDADAGESSTGDENNDTEEPMVSNAWVRSRRNSSAVHIQHPRSVVLEPEQQPISAAAVVNWGNQLAAQIQQFQQNVRTFQLPVNLQDYQDSPVVRRISSLVPHRMQVPLRTESDSSNATVVEEPSWRNYLPFQSAPSPPPPSYDHLYPGHGESSNIVKKLNNVAEKLLDQKAATMESTVEASSSVTPVVKGKLDVRIGRKPLSKEKQEALREAHAQQLMRITTDRNLWFFWFPLLIVIVCMMLYNLLPSLFSGISSVATSIGSRIIHRVVEIA